MDIKIEKKKAFKVAGIKSDVTKSSNFPKVWDRLVEKVPREKFEEFGNGQIFGVGYDYIMDEEDSFIYLAGFDLTDEVKAEETVALLSKLDVDKHINIEIELDELDLTSAESKATYAQYKD